MSAQLSTYGLHVIISSYELMTKPRCLGAPACIGLSVLFLICLCTVYSLIHSLSVVVILITLSALCFLGLSAILILSLVVFLCLCLSVLFFLNLSALFVLSL